MGISIACIYASHFTTLKNQIGLSNKIMLLFTCIHLCFSVTFHVSKKTLNFIAVQYNEHDHIFETYIYWYLYCLALQLDVLPIVINDVYMEYKGQSVKSIMAFFHIANLEQNDVKGFPRRKHEAIGQFSGLHFGCAEMLRQREHMIIR